MRARASPSGYRGWTGLDGAAAGLCNGRTSGWARAGASVGADDDGRNVGGREGESQLFGCVDAARAISRLTSWNVGGSGC